MPGAGLPIVLLGDRQTVGGYSEDRDRGLGRPAAAGPPAAGPDRALRRHHGRRGGALRREQEARLARAIAGFPTARPPGGIDLARLYEENLIDGVVYERDSVSR